MQNEDANKLLRENYNKGDQLMKSTYKLSNLIDNWCNLSEVSSSVITHGMVENLATFLSANNVAVSPSTSDKSTKKFDISKYSTHTKPCMHCSTEEEAKMFTTYLSSIGRTWISGDSYRKKTYFNCYENKTVYYFNSGEFGGLEDAVGAGREILEFHQYDWGSLDEYIRDYNIDDEVGCVSEYQLGPSEVAPPSEPANKVKHKVRPKRCKICQCN